MIGCRHGCEVEHVFGTRAFVVLKVDCCRGNNSALLSFSSLFIHDYCRHIAIWSRETQSSNLCAKSQRLLLNLWGDTYYPERTILKTSLFTRFQQVVESRERPRRQKLEKCEAGANEQGRMWSF